MAANLHDISWWHLICHQDMSWWIFLYRCIIYAFACLPYFLQWFYALLNCFFKLNCTHLHFLLLCRLLPVPLPRFKWLLVHIFSFLLLLQSIYCFHFAVCFFVCLTSGSLDVFLICFLLVFFCFVNQIATQICACSFSFFLAPLFVLLLFICLCTFISYRKPLDTPKFLNTILSEHHHLRCRLPVFFRCVHTSQNIPCSRI